MNTNTHQQDTLTNQTFANVSRNFSKSDLERIIRSRELPEEWIGMPHQELAHHLYWKEKDEERHSQR